LGWIFFTPSEFHPGDVIDALIAISNEATEALKITTIAGALTSPINRLMYYQNVCTNSSISAIFFKF